jgi:hypothetical protein
LLENFSILDDRKKSDSEVGHGPAGTKSNNGQNLGLFG